MKKIILSILCIVVSLNIDAQHFYYRLDVGTNNIYSFAVANLATAGLNTLVDDMLFDNAYTYTYIQAKDNQQSVETKGYNIAGITARDLFSDITTGIKLGYQSYYPSTLNWGIYGSAHYRINQFKTIYPNYDDAFRHNVQRLLLGGGLFFNIGNIESSTKVVIEAGIRYETPLHYNGINGLKLSDALNKGVSSHYAIRINGNGAFQGLGIYADVPHYKLFKETGKQKVSTNVRMFTFGVVYTITPWRIKELYDL